MSQVDRILPFRQPVNEVELETTRARATERLFAMAEPAGRPHASDLGAMDETGGADDQPQAAPMSPAAEALPAAVRVVPAPMSADTAAVVQALRVVDHDRPIELPRPAPRPSPSDGPPVTARAVAATPVAPKGVALERPEPADRRFPGPAPRTDAAPRVAATVVDTPAPAASAQAVMTPRLAATPSPVAEASGTARVQPRSQPAAPHPNAPDVQAASAVTLPPAARHQPAAPRRARAARATRTAYCPYCALALDPAPAADLRCDRCRHLIVVREIDGRIVHLTEAAVAVFEAERTRAANIERWTTERHRWLEYARLNGAPMNRIERMERAPAESADAVDKARRFFDATVDRAVEEALRHDRWEVAALLRRDQAHAIRRIVDQDGPPTDEMIRRCRQAAELELRGIATMARTAVVVGSRCCDACRADDGAVFRIAGELRRARLPHADCPKGLCGCQWDLAPRDVLLVQHYLQRTDRWPEMAGQVPTRPAGRQPIAR